MDNWYQRNKFIIPWALLGFEVAISVGLHLYKLKTGLPPDSSVVPSPLQTLLPKLSEAEVAKQAYPPDAYPGARDVQSPYGSLRVYEWGPEDGRKVLLVHGITNPTIALGAIAHGLADIGCRVMLFDLPGRGYSATPVSTPHSARLYTSCILLALTSSPIAWTGNDSTFALIGYSLGGGIVVNFTSYCPSLVSSLVLIAPAGLVRPEHFTMTNKFLYNTGLISETILEGIIKSRLRRGETPAKPTPPKIVEGLPVTEEVPDEEVETVTDTPELSRLRPDISVPKVIEWQLDHHPGFVKSFISSIRYGPISNQHADWRRIGQRLSVQHTSNQEGSTKEGLQNGKVLVIAGEKDVLVVRDELVEDAADVLGKGNVEFAFVDAGHELPVTKSVEIVRTISEFWKI